MNTHRNLSIAVLALALALTLTAVSSAAAEEPRVVNVNKADESQLALLPRIGPALAARIIEYREENGELKDTEDLMLVRGIGEKTFELLEPFVTTSGETTLTEKLRASEVQAAREKSEGSGEGSEG